jgi:hypothetical protein
MPPAGAVLRQRDAPWFQWRFTGTPPAMRYRVPQ